MENEMAGNKVTKKEAQEVRDQVKELVETYLPGVVQEQLPATVGQQMNTFFEDFPDAAATLVQNLVDKGWTIQPPDPKRRKKLLIAGAAVALTGAAITTVAVVKMQKAKKQLNAAKAALEVKEETVPEVSASKRNGTHYRATAN